MATQTDTRLSDLVAEEIRAMMARRRISGRKLADALGVSHTWVSYRLTGSQEIGLNDLQRIADVLDVDAFDLLPSAERGAKATHEQSKRSEASVRTTPAPAPQPNGGGRRTFPTGVLPQVDEVSPGAYGFVPSQMMSFTPSTATL